MGTFIEEYNDLSARIVGLYDVAQKVGAEDSMPSALTTYNLSGYIGSIPGYKHFSDYIQDGLVLGWDGIENAGAGTHAWELSSIYDHSGNNYNGSILSGSIFNNGIYLHGPGAKIYNDSATEISAAIDNREITVEVLAQRMEWDVDNRYALWGTRVGTGGVRTYLSDNSTPSHFVWEGSNYSVPEQGRIPTNDRYAITTLTQIGQIGSLTYYRDGLLAGTTTIENPQTHSGTQAYFRIGGWGSVQSIPNPMVNMNYYCVRVYNRSLTADEIAHNRKVDVARFNIQTQLSGLT